MKNQINNMLNKVWPLTTYHIVKNQTGSKWKLMNDFTHSQSEWISVLHFESRSIFAAKKRFKMYLDLLSEIKDIKFK